MEFYKLSARQSNGNLIDMNAFKGKVVLIVNTATQCRFTPQFEGLEELYQKYKDKGLVVLGFPCNQFAGQEPETNDNMENVCQVNYGVSFILTEKVDVNGEATHPIFKFLKKELSGILGSRIKWNFTKFLISPEGKPYKRYAPTTQPKKIEKDITRLLS